MIENAVIKLLDDERFYANFILNMRRIYTDKVPTAGVNITDKINLYINKKFWESQTLEQQADILKHEAAHVFNGHPIRAKNKGIEYSNHKMWNIACDIVVNEPLKSLHEIGCTFEKLKQEYPDALPNETADYYYKLIQQMQEENEDQLGELVDDHQIWDEGNEETTTEIQKEVLKETLKKAVEQSGGIGNCPNEVQLKIHELNRSTVNWKTQLRQFFANAENSISNSTRKKRNRRYGTIFPGKKRYPKLKIAVVNDESGSVSDEEYKQIYSEIDKIKGIYNDRLELQVIHCDTKINKVYEYKKGMEFERTGCGGTYLEPGIQKAIELNVDGIILFSDGEIWGDKYTKPKFPVLWGIVRNPDIKMPFGRKINVELNYGKR